MDNYAITVLLITLVISFSLFQAYTYTNTLIERSSKITIHEIQDCGLELINSMKQSLIYGKHKLTLNPDIKLSLHKSIVILKIILNDVVIALYEIDYTILILSSRDISVNKDKALEFNNSSDFTIKILSNKSIAVLPFIKVINNYKANSYVIDIILPIVKVKGYTFGSIIKLSVKESLLEDEFYVNDVSTLIITVNNTSILSASVNRNCIVHYRIQTPKIILLRI